MTSDAALNEINLGLKAGVIDPMQAFALFHATAGTGAFEAPPPSGPTPDADLQRFGTLIEGFNSPEQTALAQSLLALAPPAPTPAIAPAPTVPTTVSNTGVAAPVLNQPFGADFFEPTLNATVDLVAIEQQKLQFEADLAERTRQFDQSLALERAQFEANLENLRLQFGLDQQALDEQIRQFDQRQQEAVRQFNVGLDFQRQQFDANQAFQQQQFTEQARQFDVGSGLDIARTIAQLRANPASAAELAILQGGIVPGAAPFVAQATDFAGGAATPGPIGSTFRTGNQAVTMPRTFSGAQLNAFNAAPDLAANVGSFARAAGDPNLFQRSLQALVPTGFTNTGSGLG